MRIDIYEKVYNKDSNSFTIELVIESNQIEIQIQNPNLTAFHTDLEWYYELYVNEPYTSERKIKAIVNGIFSFGCFIFSQIFSRFDVIDIYRTLLSNNHISNLNIEIYGHSSEFELIPWETIFDTAYDKPLILLGVNIVRKSNSKTSRKIIKGNAVNTLIVTARPNEETDVSYRTIQQPIIIKKILLLQINCHKFIIILHICIF